MAEEVIIRPAVRSDLGVVTHLWKDLMDLTAIYNPRYRLRVGATELQRGTFNEYLRRNDSYIIVAEVDGKVVAFSNGYLTVPAKTFAQTVIGVLENLYVVEAFRGRGLGRQTAESAAAWMTEKGALEIYVNVIPKNEVSVKFWQALGYEVQRLAMTRPT